MTIVVTPKGNPELVLACSDRTQVVEGNHYFPPEVITPGVFSASDTSSMCPWKGTAAYHNLSKNDVVIPDIAWSYPDAKPAASNIKGYVAFYQNKVDIQTL